MTHILEMRPHNYEMVKEIYGLFLKMHNKKINADHKRSVFLNLLQNNVYRFRPIADGVCGRLF
jgi:hypothetical protein